MTMQAPTLQNSKTPATMCTEKGCTNVAAYSYVWPWGEPGACCQNHRLHVQQRSTNLDRGQIYFVAIDPHYVAPITRDERTQLIAAKLSLQQDLDDVKARSAELYALNTKATAEARRLTSMNAELTSQLADAKTLVDRLVSERDAARADTATAQLELQRVKAMLPADPTLANK